MKKTNNQSVKWSLVATIFAIIYSANVSHSMPLFGETAGTIKQGIVTLYKDHQDPKKVYFFPNSTQFSKDSAGVPLFNFVSWGIKEGAAAAGAGAYLSMSTHLASDESQQKALKNYMAQYPEMEVAVLPIKSSMVGLQTNVPGAQPLAALFTEFNFAKAGGRAEDEIGVNAVLTPVGAIAFRALLKKGMGGGKLNLFYCYKIQGLGPNMDAEIKVDMRRVYDYFEGSHSGGWGWFSWDIKRVVETLNNEKSIVIKMNGGDAKEWEVLNKVAETITARLFKPEIAASPISPASGNNVFRFGAGSVHKNELQSEKWTWTRRDLEEREFCTPIMIKDLQQHLEDLVTTAD